MDSPAAASMSHRRGRIASTALSAHVLLVQLFVLADKPRRSVGWVHVSSYSGVVGWGCATAAAAPAHDTPRGRVLHTSSRRRRIARWSRPLLTAVADTDLDSTVGAPVLEAAAAGTAAAAAPGTGAVPTAPGDGDKAAVGARNEAPGVRLGRPVGRDAAKEKLKRLGREGGWQQALEALDMRRKSSTGPVRGLILRRDMVEGLPVHVYVCDSTCA